MQCQLITCTLRNSSEEEPEPPKTLKMESFGATVNGYKSLTIVTKFSVIDYFRALGSASGAILKTFLKVFGNASDGALLSDFSVSNP